AAAGARQFPALPALRQSVAGQKEVRMTPSETVQCVSCRLFSLQKHAGMAREGYGKCELDAAYPGRFQSSTFDRHCPHFAEALGPVVEKRIEWLREQRQDREEACRQWK